MGLDVYLYYLPDMDTERVAVYSEKSNKICFNVQRDNKSRPTEQEVADVSERCLQLALEIGLPPDIQDRVAREKQEIDLPSVKYPQEYRIGYWRSGYGGGGIDTILKATIGSGLSDAFPQVHRGGSYIKPNWQRSFEILQDMLARFQSKGCEDQEFLKLMGLTIDLSTQFIESLTPQTLQKQQLLTQFQDCLTPQSLFDDYVREIEAILETVEYVLSQPDKDQYILLWSS